MKKILLFLLCALTAAGLLLVSAHTRGEEKEPAQPQKPERKQKMIDVPALCQYPELPTGCESVAAVMVLHYYGEDITAGEFVISWLKYSESFYRKNGSLYGPDPHRVFAGNPFKSNAYGCFAEPIVSAVNRNSTVCKAKTVSGQTLPALCREFIDQDKPLLIWATSGMKPSGEGTAWILEDGSSFTWTAGEHCLVLVGYNADYYFLNDPISGSAVAYPKSIVEKRFAELGSQAVCISPNEI